MPLIFYAIYLSHAFSIIFAEPKYIRAGASRRAMMREGLLALSRHDCQGIVSFSRHATSRRRHAAGVSLAFAAVDRSRAPRVLSRNTTCLGDEGLAGEDR